MRRSYILNVKESQWWTRFALILERLGGIRFVMLVQKVELAEDVGVVRRDLRCFENGDPKLVFRAEILQRFVRGNIAGGHQLQICFNKARESDAIVTENGQLRGVRDFIGVSPVDFACRRSLRPY